MCVIEDRQQLPADWKNTKTPSDSCVLVKQSVLKSSLQDHLTKEKKHVWIAWASNFYTAINV